MTAAGKPHLMACDDVAGPLVYVLDCDHGTKVGVTSQTVFGRVNDLERGAGLLNIRVVGTWQFKTIADAKTIEKAAHWVLRDTKTISEWFHCHPLEAVETVQRILTHGIPLESWMSTQEAANVRYYLALRKRELAA